MVIILLLVPVVLYLEQLLIDVYKRQNKAIADAIKALIPDGYEFVIKKKTT